MKKGFTLIEIIAIIILLSVIALIVYPVVNGIINNNKDKLYDKQIEELRRHTKSWVTENLDSINLIDGYTRNVTFQELYEAGFITDSDVKNPKTSESLSGCMTIVYDSSITGFNVTYNENCN